MSYDLKMETFDHLDPDSVKMLLDFEAEEDLRPDHEIDPDLEDHPMPLADQLQMSDSEEDQSPMKPVLSAPTKRRLVNEAGPVAKRKLLFPVEPVEPAVETLIREAVADVHKQLVEHVDSKNGELLDLLETHVDENAELVRGQLVDEMKLQMHDMEQRLLTAMTSLKPKQ